MSDPYRVGNDYPIHVYQGDRPVATFFTAEEAKAFVDAVNRVESLPEPPRTWPVSTKEVRRWLREEMGRTEVSETGRLPDTMFWEYLRAHPEVGQ